MFGAFEINPEHNNEESSEMVNIFESDDEKADETPRKQMMIMTQFQHVAEDEQDDPEEDDGGLDSDDDAALFDGTYDDQGLRTGAADAIEGDNNEVVAQISNRLESIIEKGTRKKQKEIDLAERKRLRELRVKMIQAAKTDVFANFIRIISFNRLQSMDLTRAVLLSLIPDEYFYQWINFDFSHVKSMPGAIKNLLAWFNEYFTDYFDVEKSQHEKVEDPEEVYGKTIISLPFKLMLPSRQPLLSSVEYQALFVAFLSLHKHLQVRTSFILDVSVTKKNQLANGDDKYEYKKSRKAQAKKSSQTKKRTSTSAFMEAKLKSKEELETVIEDKEEYGTALLAGEESKQGRAEKTPLTQSKSKTLDSMLERFAYTPVLQANLSKPRRIQAAQRRTVQQVQQKSCDLPPSNLFIRSGKSPGSSQQMYGE